MTNLMLTSRCNLSCDFCFAIDIMGGNSGLDISFNTFQKYVDHLDRSGLGQVRLLGGEPTLHPEFPRFLDYSRSRGKTVLIFSNGLIPLLVYGIGLFLLEKWFNKVFRTCQEERVLFLFGFFLTIFVVLTVIGIFFRGPGMSLYWPWEISAVH